MVDLLEEKEGKTTGNVVTMLLKRKGVKKK
jgi:hypothetical protein